VTAVVIPTIGRPSLARVLASLADDLTVVVVDDRCMPEPLTGPLAVPPWVTMVHSAGRGPAAARNAGWRAVGDDWVVFLDDDVVPDPDWRAALDKDLADAAPDVGGVQAVIRVPLPADRAPTDLERQTAGLEHAAWITADMAYRRSALVATGGFDERFPAAFREDSELAYRVRLAGWRLTVGERVTRHPVRPAGWLASVRAQRGNADDALLRRLYGSRWRTLLGIPPGRRARHAIITAAALVALLLIAARRPLPAALAASLWAAGTTEFAGRRIAQGPRTPPEILRMLATSTLIPPAAVAYWLKGLSENDQGGHADGGCGRPAVSSLIVSGAGRGRTL
jgi:hypothetical protein